MKIEYSWNDGVAFGDGKVDVGDCFLYNGRVLMRVANVNAFYDYDESVEYNAVDLSTGDWFGICDDEKVIPIEAKIIIDP